MIDSQERALSIGEGATGVAEYPTAIEDHYATVQLNRDLRLETEQTILEQIATLRETEVADRDRLIRQQRKLLDERAKLLEAHYAGAIPLDLLKTEQDRIASALDRIEDRVSASKIKFETIEARLKAALPSSATSSTAPTS